MRKKAILALGIIVAIGLIYILLPTPGQNSDQSQKVSEKSTVEVAQQVSKIPEYIGSTSCAKCHVAETEAWRGSHHDLAMQHANSKTVLGDFNNTAFIYFDVTSRFYIKDGKYYVNTDGPDGKLTEYEVKYVFGVDPLQQYLIELPGGRLQALGIAWDARTKALGGQRWYHLYPDEKISHTDRLHWTKADQNWNYMCADCHSTNLKKNYNLQTDTYDTRWSEINVACEACHGPASRHVNWANKKSSLPSSEQDNKGLVVKLDERASVSWQIDSATGTAKRSNKRNSDKEIEICARCHSRRSQIDHDYTPGDPLMNSYQPALLTEFLYHADGQIKEEVYVYGSFIQSKMYHQGVTCSDCHEPHSLKLRAEGNAVCLQCHSAEKFNKTSHHFHKLDNEGARCSECHMPQTTYMGVDGRHDHSIRIPRPDLSITLNTPNACNQCHEDKSTKWANDKVESWYGKDWSPGWHFGETLHEARTGSGGTDSMTLGQDLAGVAASPKLPGIARATAADLLQAHPSPTTYVVVKRLLQDKNPMVRLSALQTLDSLEAQHRVQLGFNLLSDSVRAVRIEAARILAVVPRDMLSAHAQSSLDKAIDEYRQAQLVNSDRPESHINLGLLAIRLQESEEAEKSYMQALKLDPLFVNAYVNLADLYRMQQQDEMAEKVLQKGLIISDKNADLHHSLGLVYVRQQQMQKALSELKTAWYLEKDNARYGYVYAVALEGNGKPEQAIAILKQLHNSHLNNQEILIALISYLQKVGDNKEARGYAEKLININPAYGSVNELLQRLGSP